MSLTVRNLNGDASFLLTFEPSLEDRQFRQINKSAPSQTFTVLTDPWLIGETQTYHSKFSLVKHSKPPLITSLAEIPPPDIVVISQPKSDHCNEATLKTLPASGTKTIIYAEPAAAKIIRSWNYFDESKIVSFQPYVAPQHRPSHGGRRIYTKNQTLQRILLPALAPGGHHGQVTLAFIPQRFDVTGLHTAIGITYRPPTASPSTPAPSPRVPFAPSSSKLPPTPPDSPAFPASTQYPPITTSLAPIVTTSPNGFLGAPSPAVSPTVTHATRFAQFNASSASIATTATSASNTTSLAETLSVIFSPHGIALSSLNTYVTHQLTPFVQKPLYYLYHQAQQGKVEPPLPPPSPNPLTLLLHCFDNITNPWYLGGTICTGFKTGAEIAKALNAKTWISTHDEDKDTTGFATKLVKVQKMERDDLQKNVAERKGSLAGSVADSEKIVTDVRILETGEEVRLS